MEVMQAVAISLRARRLSVNAVAERALIAGDASVPSQPHTAPAPTGYEGRTSALRLPARPRAIPNTETLESFMEPPATPDTSPLHPFPRLPVTQGRGTFRRTLLLPARPDIADA